MALLRQVAGLVYWQERQVFHQFVELFEIAVSISALFVGLAIKRHASSWQNEAIKQERLFRDSKLARLRFACQCIAFLIRRVRCHTAAITGRTKSAVRIGFSTPML